MNYRRAGTLRYVFVRVAIGLLIGIGLFYFRQAHAQDSCPAGQTAKYKYKNSQYGGSGTPGNHPQNFSLFSSPSAAATANLVPSGTSQAGCVYAGSHSENYGTPPDYRYFQNCSGGGWTGNGQEIRVEVVCVEGQQCQADLVGFWKYTVGSENPASVCKENCRYDKAKERKVEVSGFATEYKANYTAVTPASCTIGGPTPEPGDIQATPGPTETPIGTHDPIGTAAEQGQQNCGLINGTPVCLDAPTGNGQCTQLPSGAGFCVSGAGTADQPPKLPPENNDAPPLGTLTETRSDGTTTTTLVTNFYSSNQFNSSSNYGQNPDPDPDPGSECGTPGQPACPPDGGGEGEEGDGSFSAPDGVHGFTDGAAEIAAKRAELAGAFEAIRGEAGAIFGGLEGGAGSLPSYSIQTICCGVITVNMNAHAEKIAWLGALLIFVTLVLAAFIILGAD